MKKAAAALILALLVLFAAVPALGDSEGVVVQKSCNIVQSGQYYLAYCFAQIHNNSSTVICLENGTFDLQNGETILSTSEISQIWPYFVGPDEDGYLFDIVSFEPDENGNPVLPTITDISYDIHYMAADDISVAFGLYTDTNKLVYADGTTLKDVGIPAGGTVLVRFDIDSAFISQWKSYNAMPTQAMVSAAFRNDED